MTTRWKQKGRLALASLGAIGFVIALPYTNASASSSNGMLEPGYVLPPGNDYAYGYGTDTNGPVPSTMSGGVWQEPGGPSSPYDFYAGEVGVFNQYAGCGGTAYTDITAADDASYDTTQVYAMGSTAYYQLAGPGIDGNYGSSSAAYNWGYNQAEWLLNSQMPTIGLPNNNRIIWADIEGDADTGGSSWGWNSEGNSCGDRTGGSGISGSIDRATFNGFYDAITNAGYRVGVYSSAAFWSYSFGGYGNIPNTLEWTYESQVQINPAPALSSWCTQNVCAQFFGGQIAGGPNALAWQWSSSATNGHFDYDVSAW